jgi:arginine/lysine/ornithine decarboxylase
MPELLELASNRSIDAQVRIAVIETLGWYGFAYNKDEIVKMCNEILDRDSNPREVKDEALKTRNRILAGFNNPVTS